MKLFNFFKKTEAKAKNKAIESYELLANHKVDKKKSTEDIDTPLSLAEDWEISQEQLYVFQFLSNDLEPLKHNQLSISGIDLEHDLKGNTVVKAFVRQTLDEAIELGEVELLLLDEKGELIASQRFDLSELGTLPPRTARPWVFVFDQENVEVDEVPEENWTIAFNVESMMPHRLDLDEAWEKALSQEQKDSLAKVIEGLPKLQPKEVNIIGFQITEQEDQSLAVSLFVRNGHTKRINIEQMPLEILDANQKVVAKGSFDLAPLSVKANTSKPWTFIFPKEMVNLQDADLSRWTAKIPQ